MSSSPLTDLSADRPARWHSPAGWPLRTRIVAILIVLLTALGLVVGTTAEIFLRHQLYDQVDSRLDKALHPQPPGGENRSDGGGFPRGNRGGFPTDVGPFLGVGAISQLYNPTTHEVDPGSS